MANSIIQFKTSLNSDSVDLKKILLPLIGFVRVFALQNQLNQTNTIERLEALTENKVFTLQRKNELVQIYNFLMQLRLKNHATHLLRNESPENNIEYGDLSIIEQNTLKKSHIEINQLQLKLSLEFKGGS